jgi:hypothetical protein
MLTLRCPQQLLLPLQRLPCLRELLLPSFRPALPHEQLPALARLTQLEVLTVSVQVRAVCRMQLNPLLGLC